MKEGSVICWENVGSFSRTVNCMKLTVRSFPEFIGSPCVSIKAVRVVLLTLLLLQTVSLKNPCELSMELCTNEQLLRIAI